METTLDINELMADMPAPVAAIHTLTVGEGEAAWQLDYAVFGEGPRNAIIIPGLSLKPVTPRGEAVAIHYGMFCRDFTVYLLDPRKDLPQGYTLQQFADDVVAAMDALGIREACVYGASMGGMVSQWLAIRHPERVRALGLGSTACRHTPESHAHVLQWRDMALRCAEELAATGSSATSPRFAQALVSAIYSEASQKAFGQMLLEANDDADEADYRKVAILTEAVAQHDSYQALTGVTCPVLVLGAQADKVVPPQSSAEIAAQTGGQLHMFGPEFGHAAYDEAPDYTLRLYEFFARAEGLLQ